MYRVEYAGIELSSFCKIEKIQRTLLPPRTNFSKEIPTMHGSIYTGYKYGERVIEIDIAFSYKNLGEYTEKIRKLAEILDVKNPSKLILGDEPNKYYYAVVDGDSEIEKLFNKGAKATITFICHDPLAYSTEWKCFTKEEKDRISIVNEGTSETSPIIEVDFKNNACFLQVTNAKGQTVLIGQPKDSVKPTQPLTDVVINDPCESSSTVTSIAESLLDSKRKTSGQYGVGYNGNGFVCTNYGGEEEGNWNGCAFKRNLGANVDEFEVEVNFAFTSEGKNYVEPPAPPVPPPPPTPSVPNPPTTNTYGTYQVVNCGGLWINREANTKYPIFAMAPNTKIYPTEIKGNWYKHTHKAKYGTYTGWSYGRYLKKISSSVVKSVDEPGTREEFAEDEVGILEIYGFDQNGAKLFKAEISDTNKYYEYVEPKFYIGSKLVLDDGKNCPSPRKIDVKDDNGKVTEQREVESGVFGEWNDLIGKVLITREKNSKGEYFWNVAYYKLSNGKIINTMTTQNSLSDKSYPKGQLNYLGFYIGKFGKERQVDLVSVTNIKVRRLNFKMDQNTTDNLEIFKKDDHMQIDFAKGLVKLNDMAFLSSIDIGSEFFTIPVGSSQIAVKSDDASASVLCGIQEKFL